MAAHLRALGTAALRSSSPLSKNIMGNKRLSTLKEFCCTGPNCSYKPQMVTYLSKHWSRLSHENRMMLKQAFINLSVPAAYSGVLWLVSTSVDFANETLFNRGTPDEMSATHLPAEIEAIKEDLDEKLLQLFKSFEGSVKGQRDEEQLKQIIISMKNDSEAQKFEIYRLKGEVLEKASEIKMLRELLAGRMGQVGILWMKYFVKNLKHSSFLSYYDPPEAMGLIYWNPN